MNHFIKSKTFKIAIALVLVLVIFLIVQYKPKTVQKMQAPTVIVKKPVLMKRSDYLEETGNTVAYHSVDLVARVSGYLNAVTFADGSIVKKGTPLMVIEPEPYAEQLKQAEASVLIQKSGYAYDKAEYERQLKMYKQNASSLNEVQKWQAKSNESQASIDKAVADANIAAINYSYTHIAAPFDGRISRHLVDPGNYVSSAKPTKLATIEQLDPIYVYFNPNELDLLKLRAIARARGFTPEKISQIPVYVGLQNEQGYSHRGRLDYISTGLNASTGTIEFRAVVPNKGYVLQPGLFVRVRIALTKPIPRLTVPDSAVQYDQVGAYLLVVDRDNRVVLKRVTTGSDEKGMIAIVKGLDAEDDVIVDGLQNATPGNQVTPKTRDQDDPITG